MKLTSSDKILSLLVKSIFFNHNFQDPKTDFFSRHTSFFPEKLPVSIFLSPSTSTAAKLFSSLLLRSNVSPICRNTKPGTGVARTKQMRRKIEVSFCFFFRPLSQSLSLSLWLFLPLSHPSYLSFSLFLTHSLSLFHIYFHQSLVLRSFMHKKSFLHPTLFLKWHFHFLVFFSLSLCAGSRFHSLSQTFSVLSLYTWLPMYSFRCLPHSLLYSVSFSHFL